MAFISSLLLIGIALAEEDSEDLVTEVYGYLYSSETSINGIGLTNVYCNSNSLNDSGGRVLSWKVIRSGSGAYNHSSSELLQNGTVRISESGYESAAWMMENIESTKAANADAILKIPGSFKSKPISLLWRDSALTANYPGLFIANSELNYAKAFDKEFTMKIYSDSEDFADYNGTDDASIGNRLDLKTSFNGMGHLGIKLNNDIKVDEDYRGSFTVSRKIIADRRKEVDYGEYDTDLEDYPWLSCCAVRSEGYKISTLIPFTINDLILLPPLSKSFSSK